MQKHTKKNATNPQSTTPPGAKVAISLRLNADHLERVRHLAARKGVGASAIVQIAVAEYLEREEQ